MRKIIFLEFVGGYLPHISLTAKDNHVLHAITLKSKSSAINSSVCTHDKEIYLHRKKLASCKICQSK